MKFIVQFVKKYYKTAEIEFESESKEEIEAILDDNNDDLWYKASEKCEEDSEQHVSSIGVAFIKEKSDYEKGFTPRLSDDGLPF